ncbi:MAG: DUF2182 domain-containing protein [Pseudomonadota bacterium]
MSARLISRYADDPRVLTVIVTALIAAVLWMATWQTMSGMSGMSMDGMEMGGGMSMDKPMEMGDAMQADKPMQMENMPSGGSMVQGEMAESMQDTMSGDAQGGMSEGMSENMSSGMSSMSGNMAGGMAMDMDMPGMSMDPTDWSMGTIAATTTMWILMMAAMMLPAMAPVMAIYAGLAAKEDSGARLALRIGVFTMGYFLLWAVFSVAAALGQLSLRGSEWFTMGGTLALPVAAGLLLIIAGAYQLTPIKEFCLRHCRHPLTYLMSHWREGLAGAFPVGARHGVYCLGCCIALMGLMFVFGAMDVFWMAMIALYFLAEKILPAAEIWGKIFGGLLILAGIVTLAQTVI